MNKAYERINWENYPSENTALNEANLNKMDAALNEVDNRVVAHETTKLDVATANSMVRNISFNERTGIFTVTYLNGSTKELDTKLEKIATNFEYDAERQKLILTLIDGTTQEIDMSALITEYEFENSAYINWTVVNGKVKAEIINGSITADKLQPDFLADVTLQANSAKTSEQNAKTSEENAKQSEINAKNYADSAEPVASTAQGLNPTLENSTSAPIISFKGDGATEQQTYSGKNLCPLGSITGDIFADIPIDHLADGTYTLSCVFNSTDTDYTTCALYKQKTGTYLTSFGRGSRKAKAFTKESDDTFIRVYAGADYRSSEGDTVTVSDIQIELGETATDYEPYVGGIASPNPFYPQEIHGVGESGVLPVKSTGKNVLPLALSDGTNKGISYTVDKTNGIITLNGTATADTIIDIATSTTSGKFLELNTEYIVSFGDDFANTNGVSTIVGYKKVGYDAYTYPVYAEGIKEDDFKISAKYESLRVRARVIEGTTVSNLKVYPMIRPASEADGTYKPYVETTADIPLASPLYEKDYIRYNMDGSGEESHKQVEMILDGSEAWLKIGTGDSTYYAFDAFDYNYVKGHVVLSSHFIYTNISTSNTAKGIDVINSTTANKARIAVRPNIAGITDLETWKAWLADNKPNVVCEMTEPIVTPLTEAQIAEFAKLRTFDGTTHVTCEAESEIQYFYDSVSGKTVAMIANMLKK